MNGDDAGRSASGLLEALNHVFSIVGVIALMAGGAFGAYEYLDRKETERAAETLRMIEVWETRAVEESYLRLSRGIEALLADTPAEQRQIRERIDTLRDNIVRRVMSNSEAGDYDKVVLFFTRLSLCIEADLCSGPVAKIFFADTVADFRAWFADEIERRRVLTPDHARELDRLHQRFQELTQ